MRRGGKQEGSQDVRFFHGLNWLQLVHQQPEVRSRRLFRCAVAVATAYVLGFRVNLLELVLGCVICLHVFKA